MDKSVTKMKVILSRKGWDSASGGKPNLIFDQTDEMIMLPIPENNGEVSYDDLHLSRDEDLSQRLKVALPRYNETVNMSTACHTDPDLKNLFRQNNFTGSLGQADQSQSHLRNQKIGKGDLFIFFGLFNHVTLDKERLFIASKHPRHTIFGYLQIGDMVFPQSENKEGRAELELKYPWIKNQPHWNAEKYKERSNNCIYVAAEHCTFAPDLPGCGTFNYDEELDLTRKNDPYVTHWKLPDDLNGLSITYCKNSMTQDGYFRAPGRGQELVIEDCERAEKWAEKLITEHARRKVY